MGYKDTTVLTIIQGTYIQQNDDIQGTYNIKSTAMRRGAGTGRRRVPTILYNPIKRRGMLSAIGSRR